MALFLVKLEHHPSLITSSTISPRSLSANSAVVESSCSRLALPENNNSNDLDCYNCYNSRLKSYEKSKFRYLGEAQTHHHHHLISFLDGILQVQVSCRRLVFSSQVQEIRSSVFLVKFVKISGDQQRFYQKYGISVINMFPGPLGQAHETFPFM